MNGNMNSVLTDSVTGKTKLIKTVKIFHMFK